MRNPRLRRKTVLFIVVMMFGSLLSITSAQAGTVTVSIDVAPTSYEAGESLAFSATATGGATVEWTAIRIRQTEELQEITGAGTSFGFTVPDSLAGLPTGDGNAIDPLTTYEVTVTATVGTDVATDTVTVTPVTAEVQVKTNPADLAGQVVVDLVPGDLPRTFTSVVGWRHLLDVDEAICADGKEWRFTKWSTDEENTVIESDPVPSGGLSLTARYADQGPTPGCRDDGQPAGLFRAINLNGSQVTVDGLIFERGRGADDLIVGPQTGCSTVRPATGDDPNGDQIRALLKCYVFARTDDGLGPARVTLTDVPLGEYDVYLWNWEDDEPQSVDIAINGTRVENNLDTGPRRAYRRLGPYRATVGANGRLAVVGSQGDIIFAGIEVYRPFCQGRAVTIRAVAGATTTGTAGADVILGTPGADRINSGGGDDIICAEGGDDIVTTGDGADKILGGPGNDNIDAGGGDDVVVAGDGDDTVKGGGGNDNIDTGAGNANVDGGEGNDTIKTSDGDDTVAGGGGNDTITVAGGTNTVNAGEGDDTVTGAGTNTVNAGGGADKVTTSGGNDTINGEAGNDVLKGAGGTDVIDGGDDDDQLFGGPGIDTLRGGNGLDRLLGARGADILEGGADADIIKGGSRGDTIRGGAGDDDLAGLGGNDKIFGLAGADVLRGGIGNDRLNGGAGNDELFGEDGSDTLDGAAGTDECTNGEGDDNDNANCEVNL